MRQTFSLLMIPFLLMVFGCSISGTVVDEMGVGVEGVTLTLTGPVNMETQTDEQGHYAFSDNGLINGSFTVTPSLETQKTNPASITVTGTLIKVDSVNFRIVSSDTIIDDTPDLISAPTFSDLVELSFRLPPGNGPIDSPVESWSVLAPGVGGLGAIICPLCIDQMYLYDDLATSDEPLTTDSLNQFYKKAQVGLHGDATLRLMPKTFYSDALWKKLIVEFQERGYDTPVKYEPPRTLLAQIDWDEYQVPHIVGDEVEDVAYGVGYATVHSNMFELLLIRLLGRTGLLQLGFDLDSIDFSNPTEIFNQMSGLKLLNYTRDEMLDTMDPIACNNQMGELCPELLSTLVAYTQGINQAMRHRFAVFQLFEMFDIPWPKWDVSDSVASGLAITSVFGDPGADQISNLDKLRKFEKKFGPDKAKDIFDDYNLRNAPLDASTVTSKDAFPSPVYADGTHDKQPDREIDPDSIAWLDTPETAEEALLEIEKPHASNWMVIPASNTTSGHPLLVGGPQMGYIQPNIFFEFDARTTDASFQITGVTLPGLHLAAFAGNGHNGVWSPTSAQGKTADIFVEKLCSPFGEDSVPENSPYYWHNEECKPMRIRKNAIPFTVHGPVVDWATVAGEPVAITRASYHSQRMGQSIFAYYLLGKGRAKTAEGFVSAMENFTLALNYAYINESETAYINTGLYPVRAAGTQTDLPTWGTGEWDWQGVISMDQRPHMINPNLDFFVSWNNEAAPQFYSSDGSFQRVQLLDRLIQAEGELDLIALANISETAALQDAYAITFVPLLSDYYESSTDLENEGLTAMLDELDRWTNQGQAKRLDLDEDGVFDSAGPAIIDEIMNQLKQSIEENLQIGIGGFNFPSAMGSAYQDGATSLVLMLLNRAKANGDEIENVNDHLLNCGDGTYASCRSLMTDALVKAKSNLAEIFETDNPSEWRKTAEKLQLIPMEMLPNGNPKWHWQNRPTYQQVATVH